ncbi:MAG: TlpA disulfide reductase family protein [Haliscomenobacter sp.]|uniref:TlpA family protein disulfide reductase n=1 Tax=Haliscomenobacter sp. TaxID=2717303 RepID=UPI0029B840EA|nr:TlpA disulfide reductase family protein [Haliscomenobacter sp.]MDX2071387.1 TlpA disulfide reductase family protein [Haliscomenobacter sp.]
MKLYQTIIGCCMLLCILQTGRAQVSPKTFVFEYTRHNQVASVSEKQAAKEKSLATIGKWDDGEDLIRGIYADSSRIVTYLHLDSTLSLIWHDGIFSDKVGIAFGGKNGLINLKNGKTSFMDLRIMQKTVDNSLGKGLITIEDWRKKNENLKKVKNKEKVGEYVCEVWDEFFPQYNSSARHWMLPAEKVKFPLPPGQGRFFFWGNLIVKTESDFAQLFKHTEILELKRIDSLDHFSIQQKINELLATQNGLNRSYANLPENQTLSKDSLREGQLLSGFAFRSVDAGQSISIDSICSKAAYTLIDIWASWCGPCVKAFPELQKLKDDFPGFEIISLNYADTDFNKVQKVLDKHEPGWPQGFASHQLHDLINTEQAYPAMLLLDRDRKIVQLGKPDLSLEQIRTFLEEKLK